MEKILIVEDSKSLSKLIASRIVKKFGFEVDIAGTLQEAKVFVQNNNEYFIALLDLNLPDAPDGEIVDYIASKGIPSIVLTSNMNKQTRDEILKKDVDKIIRQQKDDLNMLKKWVSMLSWSSTKI